jgi:hypothetical protein
MAKTRVTESAGKATGASTRAAPSLLARGLTPTARVTAGSGAESRSFEVG